MAFAGSRHGVWACLVSRYPHPDIYFPDFVPPSAVAPRKCGGEERHHHQPTRTCFGVDLLFHTPSPYPLHYKQLASHKAPVSPLVALLPGSAPAGTNAHVSPARLVAIPHMKPSPSPTNSYPRSWLFLALPTTLVLLAYIVNVNNVPALNGLTDLERLFRPASFDWEQLYPLNWNLPSLNLFASPSNPHRITMSLSNKLSIKDVQLKGERVLIRVDFNVP